MGALSMPPDRDLPRLLYVGDIPVTDSMAGATFLFRLLQSYPADRLCVIGPVRPGMNMLPGVQYHQFGARLPRLLRTRLSGLYCTWITWNYYRLPLAVRRAAAAFRPEATLSVSQTGGWVGAWQLAAKAKIPFHLLAHDDYAYSAYLPARFRPWAERNFAVAYRAAHSRFCISPAMAEVYERRYGVPGQVMYPIRDIANPVFTDVAPRALATKSSLTFGYAGSIHGEPNLRQVAAFAQAARARGHRLLVYSPQHAALKALAGTDAIGLDVRAPLPTSAELMGRLRTEADVMLVTGSFDPLNRSVETTLFPSKLADYSAVGLPIIVWAPPFASITRFVREHPESADVVTDADATSLHLAMDRLAASPARRRQLGEAMIRLGRRFFAPEAAREMFHRALIGAGGEGSLPLPVTRN